MAPRTYISSRRTSLEGPPAWRRERRLTPEPGDTPFGCCVGGDVFVDFCLPLQRLLGAGEGGVPLRKCFYLYSLRIYQQLCLYMSGTFCLLKFSPNCPYIRGFFLHVQYHVMLWVLSFQYIYIYIYIYIWYILCFLINVFVFKPGGWMF